MRLALVLLLVLVFCQLCISQCTPPVGPSCLIRDPRDPIVTGLINPNFWLGIGDTGGAAAGTLVNIDIQNPGDIAAAAVDTNCGFIFFGLGRGPIIVPNAADIGVLQSFYNAGGVIGVLCEWPGFDPNCATIMNPIIQAIDPTCQVQYEGLLVNNANCLIIPPTVSGSTGFFFTPNDVSGVWDISASSTFIYPTDSDPECLLPTFDAPGKCTVAQYGNFIFTTDINTFAGNVGCITPAAAQDTAIRNIGQNYGALVAACGGAGGDPHVFTFDGREFDFKFNDGKRYLFYGSEEFRIVIETTGPAYRNFITSIGVSIGRHQLLAIIEEFGPAFYFNGELVTDRVSTPFGDAVVFVPEQKNFRGALAELPRYVTHGLKINNFIEILGGMHVSQGFFNIEVVKRSGRSNGFGLLHVANQHNRDALNVADFETPNLF